MTASAVSSLPRRRAKTEVLDAHVADVIRAINANEGKPMRREAIAEKTGLSERNVRRAIAWANHQGIPVISTGAGFFLAKDTADRDKAVGLLRAEAYGILKRIADLNRTTVGDEAIQLALPYVGNAPAVQG